MTKKKLTSEEALAKIKVMINTFYSEMGRSGREERWGYWGKEINQEILLSEIDNIISKSKVDGKIVLAEQLKFDEATRGKDKEVGKWLGIDYAWDGKDTTVKLKHEFKKK